MSQTFKWSLYGAINIVIVRMVVSICIGFPIAGTTVFTLPTMTLPWWMTGIRIGGRVTREQLLATLSESLTIAGCIIIIGALVSIIHLDAILKRAPKKLQGVSIALSIALSSYPNFIESISRIRKSYHLRFATTPRLRSIATPLLEEALERGHLLAKTLSLRGFEKVAARHVESIRLKDVCYAYPGTNVDAMSEINVSIPSGQCIAITGPTGCGKSTLLNCIAGLTPSFSGGNFMGNIETFSFPHLGYMLQNSSEVFLFTSVRDELVFPLSNMGVAAEEQVLRVHEISIQAGISHLLDRNPLQLSGGEKQRVAIALAMITQPQALILDEPSAGLDESGCTQLVKIIKDLKENGTTIIFSEHNLRPFLEVIDDIYQFADGQLMNTHRTPHHSFEDEVDTSMTFVVGPNGSGKTTHLSSLINPGVDGYLPQNPSDLLTESSLAKECALNDRERNLPTGTSERMVRTFIDSDFATHPRDLSEGQKLLAVFALAIAHQPKKIYLDEPTRGLDNHMRELLRQTLVRLSDTTDIVIATHDIDFAQSLSRTIIQMEGVYA